MARDNYSDLLAFVAVAQARSFTRAAAQLGISQSALSHTIRNLETRLGLRLLTRTTRSVATTEAGEHLLQAIGPRFEEIDSELAALSNLRDQPAGTIRITATDYVTRTILWPRLNPLLAQFADLRLEIINDYGLSDIVAERYDIGVRLGDQVARDMIAVRISPDLRMTIVGSPGYLARQGVPTTPQALTGHNCINLRLPTHGGSYAWELQNGPHQLQVKVEGQSTFNGSYQMLDAALSGAGLAYLPEDLALPYVTTGQLQWVLPQWHPTFTGYHAYYQGRKQFSRALALVIDTLKYPYSA
ncbi:DNA-binding transcriptional LysR family regulator [Silvimonas terrae]|uniref:DNA-binding transcriptional LysR family regulator n=1 Tax=Silvimonas terrae TaxID=300266 RepID=A0A840RE43_9NEIS|nr:LysR family transcriptional regulator [Silvimonas terrae]MBB5190640.1 DNA-binding transcriptional LysR family regulator [Silvimonas terrae]